VWNVVQLEDLLVGHRHMHMCFYARLKKPLKPHNAQAIHHYPALGQSHISSPLIAPSPVLLIPFRRPLPPLLLHLPQAFQTPYQLRSARPTVSFPHLHIGDWDRAGHLKRHCNDLSHWVSGLAKLSVVCLQAVCLRRLRLHILVLGMKVLGFVCGWARGL
jgi:hypothetical protein